jgi:hypothetical protein
MDQSFPVGPASRWAHHYYLGKELLRWPWCPLNPTAGCWGLLGRVIWIYTRQGNIYAENLRVLLPGPLSALPNSFLSSVWLFRTFGPLVSKEASGRKALKGREHTVPVCSLSTSASSVEEHWACPKDSLPLTIFVPGMVTALSFCSGVPHLPCGLLPFCPHLSKHFLC